jgi:hypothetical protein
MRPYFDGGGGSHIAQRYSAWPIAEQTGPIYGVGPSKMPPALHTHIDGDPPLSLALVDALFRRRARAILDDPGDLPDESGKGLFIRYLNELSPDHTADGIMYIVAIVWNVKRPGLLCGHLVERVECRRYPSPSRRRALLFTAKSPGVAPELETPDTVFDETVESTGYAKSVAELLADLRGRIALPVQDLAHMCGMRRRQYYNLMAGQQPTPSSERQIRLVHAHAVHLYGALQERSDLVRAAVLTPLGDAGESYYDVAIAEDAARLRDSFAHLLKTIERPAGQLATDALPPSGRLRPGHPAWERAAELLVARGSEETPADPDSDR